ncbi:MAG: FAD-dependent oxidoreductase [Pseudomonadota bacterium]
MASAPAEFLFEGRRITARPGQSLAAALTEAGERSFRTTAQGAERSVFCGMGVCQDCLVTVDGAPNQRACMRQAVSGMDVRRQGAHVDLTALAPPDVGQAHEHTPDVLVIGGGAGGLAAARVAAAGGASVTLIDERSVAGGQYYKQAASAEPLDAQQREGAAHVARAEGAGVTYLKGVEVWGAFDGPLILASQGADALAFKPRALIVATGAYERPVMVPGWDRPGVMTTGAAQTLWRSYRTLPGERVLVAGKGPLNAQVALELAQGGADIAALVEAAPAPWRRPLSAMAMMRAAPRLAGKGIAMKWGLVRRGVPILYGARLARIDASDGALGVHITGARGERIFEVDAVLMNDGFNPSNEVLRLLGCAFTWNERFQELRPRRSATGETTVGGVFAVGDCCGLGGAPAAVAEGEIAGAAVAEALGAGARRAAGHGQASRALARARRFQDALWRTYARPTQRLDDMAPETLLCRCEEITVAQLRAALAAAPGDIGAAKRATRIGMGRCQGRYCGPALAALMADRHRAPMDERAFFAPRPPIKPVPISCLLAAEGMMSASNGGETHPHAHGREHEHG